MSGIIVVFYKEDDGSVPAKDFLDSVSRNVRLKLIARLRLLESLGHELRRPLCDYLEQGIYELRTRHVKSQYRLLYFFYGRQVIVISHGLTKHDVVPPIELLRARRRLEKYVMAPEKHGYYEAKDYYDRQSKT